MTETRKRAFLNTYASWYDVFYGDKDYAGECDRLEQLFRQHAGRPVRSVLDLGCGTGAHSLLLAERGYRVTGVDLSEAMVCRAREKAEAMDPPPSGGRPAFLAGDLRRLELGETFDAVIMMFAVLCYMQSDCDLVAALRAVRRHLKPGGLFICDFWYGPAVEAIRPGAREKRIQIPAGALIRRGVGLLDQDHHLCRVQYHVVLRKGNWEELVAEETHTMRYLFSDELAWLMREAGLELIGMSAMDQPGRPPSEETWNVQAVARPAASPAP